MEGFRHEGFPGMYWCILNPEVRGNATRQFHLLVFLILHWAACLFVVKTRSVARVSTLQTIPILGFFFSVFLGGYLIFRFSLSHFSYA